MKDRHVFMIVSVMFAAAATVFAVVDADAAPRSRHCSSRAFLHCSPVYTGPIPAPAYPSVPVKTAPPHASVTR